MRTFLLILPALLFFANPNPLHALTPAEAPARADAEAIVEQMRGIPMQSGRPRSDGKIDPVELHRQAIFDQLRMIGKAAVPALAQALEDKDMQMRRNAALVLFYLADGLDGKAKLDIREAMPALIKLLSEPDEGLRNLGCIALGRIGPAAKDALPALQKALNDPDKDVRQYAQYAIEKIQAK